MRTEGTALGQLNSEVRTEGTSTGTAEHGDVRTEGTSTGTAEHGDVRTEGTSTGTAEHGVRLGHRGHALGLLSMG